MARQPSLLAVTVAELVADERVYIASLNTLFQYYLDPLVQNSKLANINVDGLFSDIEQLRTGHQGIVNEITGQIQQQQQHHQQHHQQQQHSTESLPVASTSVSTQHQEDDHDGEVACLIVKRLGHLLPVYERYHKVQYDAIVERLILLQSSNPFLADLLARLETAAKKDNHPRLLHLLILPLRRIPLYPKVLTKITQQMQSGSLLKETLIRESEPFFAIADLFQRKLVLLHQQCRLAKVQRKISHIGRPSLRPQQSFSRHLLQSRRTWIFEGELKLLDEDESFFDRHRTNAQKISTYYCFLLSDSLIFTKKRQIVPHHHHYQHPQDQQTKSTTTTSKSTTKIPPTYGINLTEIELDDGDDHNFDYKYKAHVMLQFGSPRISATVRDLKDSNIDRNNAFQVVCENKIFTFMTDNTSLKKTWLAKFREALEPATSNPKLTTVHSAMFIDLDRAIAEADATSSPEFLYQPTLHSTGRMPMMNKTILIGSLMLNVALAASLIFCIFSRRRI